MPKTNDCESTSPFRSLSRFQQWLLPDNNVGMKIARIASLLTLAVGALVAIGGWGLKLEILYSWFPDSATMKANTAVCFMVAGVALAVGTNGAKKISQGCAIAIFAVGTLTLSEYLFGWDLGIDQLLVQDLASPPSAYPGRMGNNTALNFFLVGVALWFMQQKTRRGDRVTQVATVLAIAIALLALVGYAFGVEVLQRFIFYSASMAFPTAVTFLVLSAGILAASAERGFMKTFTQYTSGSVIARRLIPFAIGLPFVLGWLVLQGLRANFYSPAFSLALLVICLMLTFLSVIWQITRRLNQKENDLRAAIAERERLLECEQAARDQAVLVDLERKQAEKALQQSEALTKQVLESSKDCIKVLSLEGRILYLNNGGQHLLEVDDPDSTVDALWIDFW
jgi:PAS domain-containing protein